MGGSTTLWIMGVDGSNKRQLTLAAGGNAYDPTWSANGELIAYRRAFGSPTQNRLAFVFASGGPGGPPGLSSGANAAPPALSPGGPGGATTYRNPAPFPAGDRRIVASHPPSGADRRRMPAVVPALSDGGRLTKTAEGHSTCRPTCPSGP